METAIQFLERDYPHVEKLTQELRDRHKSLHGTSAATLEAADAVDGPWVDINAGQIVHEPRPVDAKPTDPAELLEWQARRIEKLEKEVRDKDHVIQQLMREVTRLKRSSASPLNASGAAGGETAHPTETPSSSGMGGSIDPSASSTGVSRLLTVFTPAADVTRRLTSRLGRHQRNRSVDSVPSPVMTPVNHLAAPVDSPSAAAPNPPSSESEGK